jgi:predicted lipid-binding transport protein (Tim44 family)
MSSLMRIDRRRSPLCPATLLLLAMPTAAFAEFEEVRIVRTEPLQIQQQCPPGVVALAPAPVPPPPPAAPPPSGGITGQEALGTLAGVAVGGLLGHQVGGGSGRTAATVAGAGVGGFAGYKLAEEKPKPAAPPPPPLAQAAPICLMTQYRVFYARQSGLQGDVVMSSQPTSQSLMINFCGDKPCM